MIKVAALYVQTNGAYFNLPDVDPWDEARDARKYDGPYPVVAHPPCARWSRLAGFTQARFGLKRGADGGCFSAAVSAVRRWGGVLEHPAFTRAFAAHGIPAPIADGWQATICGGWVCSVEQGNYGHSTSKPTWLYAVAPAHALPVLDWSTGSKDGQGSWLGKSSDGLRKTKRNDLPKNERSATPIAFRDLLISIAKMSRQS